MKSLIKNLVPEKLWVQARLFKLRFTKKNYARRVVSHNYGGHDFKVLIADPLGEGWYDGSWPRLNEVEELAHGRLKKGATVFDCGAHQSVVAMMLAKEVGENGKVIALEATRHNYQVGLENIKLNNITNLKNIHAALGSSVGKTVINESFNASIDTGKGDWGGEEVDVINLNEMKKRFGDPDVIFLDIEGFEGEALKGASDVLNTKCDWFVEIHGEEALNKFGSSVSQVLAYFPHDKFDLKYAFEGEKFRPFNKEDSKRPEFLKRFFLLAFAK